jgi:hypothetical protein
MNESIYNLVPREYVAPEKKPMHRSTHDPQQNLSGSTFGCRGSTRLPGAGVVEKKAGALFGPHKTLSNSQTFKKAGNASLSASGEVRRREKLRPAVPSKDDVPVMGIVSNKNFVTANAVEAILMVPKTSGKPELNYLKKEDYGQVPEYLSHVKEEVRRENEMIDKYINEQMGYVEKDPDTFEEMSEEERENLIYDLKQKWAAINKEYQKITHLVRLDTIGQLRRKENMESQLKQIESDIERISRAGPLLIA